VDEGKEGNGESLRGEENKLKNNNEEDEKDNI
jgi:hypothetical protein